MPMNETKIAATSYYVTLKIVAPVNESSLGTLYVALIVIFSIICSIVCCLSGLIYLSRRRIKRSINPEPVETADEKRKKKLKQEEDQVRA